MKRYRLIAQYGSFALLLAASAASCRKSAEQPSAPAPSVPPPAAAAAASDEPLAVEAGTNVLTLGVDGMHCQGCADTIAGRVGNLDGVRQARVSFNAKTAWVMVEKDSGPGQAKIVQTIEGLGYKATPSPATTRPAAAPATAPS